MARPATCMRGPGMTAGVDGLLDVHVGVAGAFGFEIANGGEAIAERTLRRHRAENGAVRSRVLQQLHVVIFGGDVALQQYVGVGVDQSGQADLAGKVDDLGAALGLRMASPS